MIIVYLFPAAFISLFLHEIAHVIAIKAIGGKIVLFKPWSCSFNIIYYIIGDATSATGNEPPRGRVYDPCDLTGYKGAGVQSIGLMR